MIVGKKRGVRQKISYTHLGELIEQLRRTTPVDGKPLSIRKLSHILHISPVKYEDIKKGLPTT